MDTFDVVAALTETQVDDLVELYQKEWWSVGRRREDVVRMLAGSSLIVGLVDPKTRHLLGFARALTDSVYKALIFDVIVATERRGEGLGAELINLLVRHPSLREVRHFELYCRPEMVPFYERWSFRSDLGELRFLRRDVT